MSIDKAVGKVLKHLAANYEGSYLYLDKENTAVLDTAFEELGCTGEGKELCYRVG